MRGDGEHEDGQAAEKAATAALVDLLAPAMDRCSALADQLAHLILDPR